MHCNLAVFNVYGRLFHSGLLELMGYGLEGLMDGGGKNLGLSSSLINQLIVLAVCGQQKDLCIH